MNRKYLRAGLVSVLASGLLVAGCTITYNPGPPPPVVEVQMVPETYVWDGTEYIGVVGGEYFYLGPGEVWLVCEPFRLERFHGWERGHPEWRREAIRNERFRKGGYGRVQPRREERPRVEQQRVAPNAERQRVTPNTKEQKATPKKKEEEKR